MTARLSLQALEARENPAGPVLVEAMPAAPTTDQVTVEPSDSTIKTSTDTIIATTIASIVVTW